jgi:hypothetical protein
MTFSLPSFNDHYDAKCRLAKLILFFGCRLLKVAPYSCKETAAQNKVFTMTQNTCYLFEMGMIF